MAAKPLSRYRGLDGEGTAGDHRGVALLPLVVAARGRA
jgi:hypothetical protein